MIRYVLALLLINAYSRSLGAPQPPNPTTALLSALANRCENQFLSAQIENRTQDCAESFLSKKKRFECLIFYDINSQLCAAVASSKLAINEDFSVKINEEQDVKGLCDAAKDWSFTSLSTKYNADVRTVFQNPVKCAKVCGVDDVDSEDSIFYCKYYKWGWDIMKTQMTTAPQVNTNAEAPIATNAPIEPTKTPEVIGNSSDIQVPKDISTSPKLNLKLTDSSSVKTTSVKIEDGNDSDSNADIKVVTSLVAKMNEGENPQTPKKVETSSTVVKTSEHQQSLDAPISLASGEVQVNKKVDSEPQPGKVTEEKKDNTVITNEALNTLNNQLERNDDYQANDFDSDEGKEGLQDTQANDDGDDPAVGDLEMKGNQIKNPPNRIEPAISSFNGDSMSQKEFYSNSIQEDFEEDDDHFFPFFLTAIILVVLLYVLYHNKGKVTKVVLGLIVEGRQQGRRRNSRGHAYRRLDTLEQAMSGNTAAPPSKIIY